MNVRHLETLVVLAEVRSFRLAAARLHTTQPAVSARIRALEQAFGTELIDRGGRRIALTPPGLEALRYARAITKLLDGMRKAVCATDTLQGVIRIGVIDTIIHSWLPRLIEHLRRCHPDVNFELTADTSLRLTELFRAGELDLVLLMGPLSLEGVRDIDLGAFPMAWVANPKVYRFDGPIDVDALAGYPILSYPQHSIPYRTIRRYFASARGLEPILNCSNSLASLVRLAADGIGIAAIPPVIIERELAEGVLAIVPVKETFPALAFTASFAEGPTAALPCAVARLAHEEATRFGCAKGARRALAPSPEAFGAVRR